MSTNTSGSRLQTTLAAIPIVTAGLYLLGFSFYQGFIHTLNLGESQFPLSVDQNLFYGFFALISLSAKQIGYFVLSAELLVIVSFATVYLSSSERVRALAARVAQHLPKKNKTTAALQAPPKITEFAKLSAQMFVIGAVILFVIFGIILVTLLSSQSGEESAKALLKKIEDGKQPSVDIFFVGQSDPISGVSLLCNATHCAYLVKKDVITYPLSSIEKTISHNISTGANSMQ